MDWFNVFMMKAFRKLFLCRTNLLFAAAAILVGCSGGSSSNQSVAAGGLNLTMTIIAGNNQVTTPSATWNAPLEVQVTSGGQGVPSIPVTFLADSTSGAQVVTSVVVTDSNGMAETTVIAPSVSDVYTTVTASLVDGTSVNFSLETRSYPDSPTLGLQDPLTLSTSYTHVQLVNVSIANVPGVVKWCLSETQSLRPSDGTQPCTGGTGPNNGWFNTMPTTFTLSPTNGVKNVFIWVADEFDDTSLHASVGTIYLKTTTPSVPTVTLSDVLSGSTTETGASVVNFSLGNDSDAVAWCIFPQLSTNPAPTTPVWNSTCWVPTVPSTLTLPVYGINEVYVWTKDEAGNVSAGPGTQFINYTTVNIPDPTFTLADPVTGSTSYARQSNVNITITNDTSASAWCVSELQTTKPVNSLAACSGGGGAINGWYNARPTTLQLSAGDGAKTVYVWVANPLNNVNPDAVTKTITVITVPPSIPLVTLSDPNTGNQSYTNQATVDVAITLDTNAVNWCLYEMSATSAPPSLPAWNNACWVGTRPTHVTLGATGQRRLYVYTKDVAQNVSPGPGVALINYITTAPASPTLTLQDPQTYSTTYTKNQTVNMTIVSPTGTYGWCVSETQTTPPATGSATCTGGTGPNNGWFTSSPTSFTLSPANGLKTVYAWVSDEANNVSTAIATATITLDRTAPAAPTVTMSDPNTGSTTNTNQFNVNLTITNDTGAYEWCPIIQLSSQAAPATPALSANCWQSVRPSSGFISFAGQNTVYLYLRDISGNVSTPGTATINYSTSPPADPNLVIADATTGLTTYAQGQATIPTITGDGTALSWCLSETQNTRPSLGTVACTGGAGPNNGWYSVRPTTFTLSAGQGTKHVYLWIADGFNNVNADPINASIILDQTLPLAPTVSLQDPNTGSAVDTNQSTVVLTIGAVANATAWCVIEQASATAAPTSPAWSNGCWVISMPTSVTLGALGSRTVYVFTRDQAYNVSATSGSASITYSTTDPATATLTLSDPTTNSTTYARQVGVNAAIANDTNAVKWCLSQTQTIRPTLGINSCGGGQGSTNGWWTTRPTTFNLTSSNGLKTIYLWTADAYDNVSATAVTANITLDASAPAIPTVSLSDPNTNSTAFTNQSVVNLSITGDTGAVSWCVIEQAATASAPPAPLYNSACFVTPRPSTTTLGGQGAREVYVYTQDVGNNISVAAATASINYSTSSPTDPILVLSDAVTGSRSYTNNASASVAINSPASAVKWCLSETQPTRPASGSVACTGGEGSSNGWYTSVPATFNLSATSGAKTVYIWVADSSNNTNLDVSSASITLLLTAPGAPTVALADPNDASSSFTNQTNVSLTITDDTGATAWCVLTQPSASPAPSTPSSSSTCWTLTRPTVTSLGAVGQETAYVYLRDPAQNISSPGTASIQLSVTPPADPTLALADANTGLTTYAGQSLLNITIGNDPTAAKWCVSETQTIQPTLGTNTCTGGSGPVNGWYTTLPTTYSLSSGDGNKRVYVWIADKYNNVNLDAVSQTIILQTSVPGGFNITGLTGGTDTVADQWLGTTTIPTVNWGAASGAISYNVTIKNAAGSTVVCATASTTATSYTFASCNLTGGTSYTAFVTAYNNSLNATAASNTSFSFTVKLTPPGAFTITGMTGGTDTTADPYAGSSLPTVNWSASTGANSYTVEILAMDGVTVMCPLLTVGSGVLAHDYSTTGCTPLSDNTLYEAEVVAYDIAGNPQVATNSAFVFRTDLTAPTVTITGNPSSQAITSSANFTFSGADSISSIASMKCQIDGGGYSACNTLTTESYTGVANGTHTFSVMAVNVVGLTATASYTWQIDSTPPTAFTITGATGPTNPTPSTQLHNDTEVTANWTTSSTATYYGVTILDSFGNIVCPTATVSAGSTSYQFATCNLTNPGSYQMQVIAYRGYGTSYAPTPLAFQAVRDTVTAVITPSANSVVSGSSVTLTMVASEDGTQMTTNVLNPSFYIASGTSTGTFGSWTYVGNGTYQTTFIGALAGTAASLSSTTSYLSGFTSVTPASVQVLAGNVSPTVSTVTASASSVISNNVSTSTITVQARDAGGNAISGATVVPSFSGGLSTGTFSSFVESPTGSGNYTSTFKGVVSGSASNVSIVVNSITLSSTPSITVLPGPPAQILATGPGTLSTQTCAGPYTVSLRDVNNNLASATDNVQINFGGITSGSFSFSSTCSATATNTTIFLGGSQAAPIYVIPYAPVTGGSLKFTDPVVADNIAAGSVTVNITPVLAWIGMTGNVAWKASGTTYPSRSGFGGLNNPRGVYFNAATNRMYVTDTANSRVVRYDMTGQNITGWVGRVDSVDGISCPGYTNPISGGVTPAWCTGGSAQASAGTNYDGMLNQPSEITGDGTYIYVMDTNNNRIVRYVESTGVYSGWYGNVNTIAGMTCVTGTPVAGSATPDWCYGGTSKASTGATWDGQFNFSTTGAIRSFYDPYSATTVLIALDGTNNRLMYFTVSTSHIVYGGWAGRTLTAVTGNGVNTTTCVGTTAGNATPGWCTGGTSQAAPDPSGPPTISNYNNMFDGLRGLAVLPGSATVPSYVYFNDVYNGRIVQFNVSAGTTTAWTGRSSSEYPGAGGTNCATFNVETGWCTGGVPIYYNYCTPACPGSGSRDFYGTYGLNMATDGVNLYMTSNNEQGVFSIPLSTGVAGNIGWIGRIYTQPTSGAGCTTTPVGFVTPNWCYGGRPGPGLTDGEFNTPTGIFADVTNGFLYTVDQVLHKVQVTSTSTGTTAGWIGAVASTIPASWLTTYSPGLMGNQGVQNEDLSFDGGPGQTGAWGINNDGTNLYVADTGNYRLKKYTMATGAYQGWYGQISAVPIPTGSGDPCGSVTSGALTPTWCFQGSSASASTTGTGELKAPMGMANDGTYLYVIDQSQHRLIRLLMSNASFLGWMGLTNTAASLTGFDAAGNSICPGVGATTFTGAWCGGGTSTSSTTGNGAMSSPRGVAVDPNNGYLFVADTGNARVNMYSTAGAFLGWVGRPNAIPPTAGSTTSQANTVCSGLNSNQTTSYWCVGGSSQVGLLNTQNFSGFSSPEGIAWDSGSIYVADTGNNKIHKFTSTTGAYLGWIGRVATTAPTAAGSGSGLTTANCTAATVGLATPGWCLNGGAQSSGTATSWDGMFNGPTALWSDPNSNYLYVVDAGNHRITKHNKASGAYIGWKGWILTQPTGGPVGTGCTTAAVGTATPDWCTGGTSQSSRQFGGFYNPIAITGDANFLYVTDSYNNRVMAIPK